MHVVDTVEKNLLYNTNYFLTISEFMKKYNICNNLSITIICVNIRSINANLDELLLFLQNDSDFHLDVIVLTETWHDPKNCIYSLPGYKTLYSTTKRNQNDGIIVFAKQHLDIDFHEFNFCEANIIKLIINNIVVPLNLICIYRSPSDIINEFLTRLEAILMSDKDIVDSTMTILLGDININIIGNDNVENNYLDLLSSNGFSSLINVYTRIPAGISKNSCIDHIFVKSNKKKKCLDNIEAGVLQTVFSDHYSTIISIPNVIKEKNKSTTFEFINFKKLIDTFNNVKWTDLYSICDVNEAMDLVYTRIFDAINISKSLRKLNSKTNRLKNWMTSGLLCSVRKKQELSLKTKKHPNNIKLIQYFKKYRNKLNYVIKMAKINYYNDQFQRVSGDPKNTWKLIKNLTNKPNTDNDIIKRLNYNGNIIDAQKEPLTASNHLNMFFSTIGQNLANKIDKCFDEVSDERTPVINFNNFFSVKIHSMEIMNIINHFKDDVACGFDKINVKILKNLAPYIINPLTHIFNLSLRLGIFPDKLKVAIIKPLHKGGDKENMNNYRPISMLSSFSKIFEKIIKARLIDYLENNSLLSKNQYGFRPRRSTEDALYAVTTFISKALDKGDKALGIFLDLAKAFDTVDHSLLIKVFSSYGINGICLNWFKSYLNKRKQITNMNGVLGQVNEVMYGVPQGSILGPILFIMYINSLCDMRVDGKIVVYADDTCLLLSSSNWETLRQKTELNFKKIIKWLNIKKLSLNFNKTMFMVFSINYTLPPFEEITLHDCSIVSNCNCPKINIVKRIKYLGLIFDCNLKWNIHINSLIVKLRSLMFKFHILKHITSSHTLRIVYLSLYQSILQYGMVIWGGASINVLKPLRVQQNSLIRICLKKDNLIGSTSLNYIEFNVLPLELLYKKSAIMFVHKKSDFFFIKQNDKPLGEDRLCNIKVLFTNTSFGQKFINYMGPVIFNALPIDVKKNIFNDQINIKKCINNILSSELRKCLL